MDTLHFMPDAAQHVRGRLKLDERSVSLGADRVRAALAGMHPGVRQWADWSGGGELRGAVTGRSYTEPAGTMSFLAAAMMCRAASNPQLIGRFAYNEALYAQLILNNVLINRLGGPEMRKYVWSVCREVIGVEPNVEPGGRVPAYTLPVVPYLKFATGLGRSWKLVNQTVHGGRIYLQGDKLVRLLRDAITAYIRDRIKKMPQPPVEVPRDIMEWCADRAAPSGGGDVPPCVEKCRSMMDAGENLQHNGRFLLATFFIQTGMDDAAIAAMFQGAPDYSEKTTKYHIGQIRRRGYSVPGCGKVQTNGLCPGCDAVHPTKYKKPAK